MKTCSALAIGLWLLVIAGPSYGQSKLDMQEIVRETQKMAQGSSEMTLVWWLPEQFWQASLEEDGKLSQLQIDDFMKNVRPYVMIAVVDGKMGSFGGVTFKNENEVRTTVTIKDAKGISYAPLKESQVNPDTWNLVQIMKPIISNLLGPLGQNLHFLLFPAKGADGRFLADPMTVGTLSVMVGGAEYKYRLPLGSVLPPRYDSATGEKFPGNYLYNPFTGGKLIAK